MFQTLRELRMELHAPYGEIRATWHPPDAAEEFALLTGETEHTLCQGKIVQVTVKKLVPRAEMRWTAPLDTSSCSSTPG